MAIIKHIFLFNIVIFYNILAFIIELIDFSCRDFSKQIMYICNVTCLQYLMLRQDIQFVCIKDVLPNSICCLKAKIDRSIKSIQKIVFLVIFLLMILYILN